MFLQNLNLRKGGAFVAGGLLALTLASCDSSFVYEDLRPCVPQYKVKISYDHNMAYTDRTDQVEAAHVYAFDSEGRLAGSAYADKATLAANNYTLDLPTLNRFDSYDIVVWGGLVADSPFSLDGTRAVTTKEDVTCRLNTEADEAGNQTSRKTFPALFHGVQTHAYQVEDGEEVLRVPLKKNTNTVDIAIRKQSGAPVEENYYKVTITDSNGVMDHQNNVSGDQIIYHPTAYTATELPLPNGQGGEQSQTSQAGVSTFHVARLMDGTDARLQISLGESGIKLIDMRLIELLWQVKAAEAPDISTQDYLDRQDTFKFDFTLREEEDWAVFELYINNWLVVINDIEWK